MENSILVINAGSSSLKFKMFVVSNMQEVFYGQIEGFGTNSPSFYIKDSATKNQLEHKVFNEESQSRDEIILEVINMVISFNKSYNIVAIGHRVVHGGVKNTQPVLVNNNTIDYLQSITNLAPLHMPHNLKPMQVITQALPNMPQVACFDTAFHTSASKISKMYSIDTDLFEKEGVMRYGAHGISYDYIANKLQQLDVNLYNAKTLVCHIGSGASLCVMQQGKCITTTMGFSVLEGLTMATRPGNIDAGVILYLLTQKNLSPKQLETMLYHKSGILGLSKFTNDFRILQQNLDKPQCKQAWDVFIFNLVKNMGALIAVAGGVDTIVFTAGVGENSPMCREQALQQLQFLGVSVNNIANNNNDMVISTESSKIKVMVVPTNEELMIAQYTANLI